MTSISMINIALSTSITISDDRTAQVSVSSTLVAHVWECRLKRKEMDEVRKSFGLVIQ
jgi:hypothetical protein